MQITTQHSKKKEQANQQMQQTKKQSNTTSKRVNYCAQHTITKNAANKQSNNKGYL